MSARHISLLAVLVLSGCVTAPVASPPPSSPPGPLYFQPVPPPRPPEPNPRRALAWASYFVPPELHAPLGLTAEALAARPPAPRDDEERALEEARGQLAAAEACLPTFVTTQKDGTVDRWPAEAWAALTLGPDGRPREVAVRIAAMFLPEPERCAAEAIARWTLGAPRLGGRLWVALRGRGVEVARPPAGDPLEGQKWNDPAGWSPPRSKEPNCVARSIRVPRDFQGLLANVTVKFAVGRDGQANRFRVLSPPDLAVEVAAAIYQAVRDCEWIPGRNPDQEPVTMWVTLPLRFLPG